MSFMFQIEREVDSKNCIEVPLGDLGKNQNWIVREKPEKNTKNKRDCNHQEAAKFYSEWAVSA